MAAYELLDYFSYAILDFPCDDSEFSTLFFEGTKFKSLKLLSSSGQRNGGAIIKTKKNDLLLMPTARENA